MTEDLSATAEPGRTGLVERSESVVSAMIGLGVLCALIGLIDGVYLMFVRRETPCPNGTNFPEGTTDFTCYVHPQAGLGTGIAALSVVAGIIVVFAGIVVASTLRSRSGGAHEDA